MISRQRFDVSVSGGVAFQDTGPPTFGAVQQVRWHHAADTGQIATMQISVLPDQADTGVGWLFYSAPAANLAVQLTKAPRQPQHGSNGAPEPADTGAAFGVPLILAGDRLKIKITPADTGVVLSGGRLYVWIKDG